MVKAVPVQITQQISKKQKKTQGISPTSNVVKLAQGVVFASWVSAAAAACSTVAGNQISIHNISTCKRKCRNFNKNIAAHMLIIIFIKIISTKSKLTKIYSENGNCS